MKLEVEIEKKIKSVEIIESKNDIVKAVVNGKEYELDMIRVEQDVYSVLYKNHSYNIELFQNSDKRDYIVNTIFNTYSLKIVDAETKYKINRNKGKAVAGGNSIVSPMPGKVVKVFVKVGDEVAEGDTLIIVSAMKMESEFKSEINGIVEKVKVKDDDTVSDNEVMIVLKEKE